MPRFNRRRRATTEQIDKLLDLMAEMESELPSIISNLPFALPDNVSDLTEGQVNVFAKRLFKAKPSVCRTEEEVAEIVANSHEMQYMNRVLAHFVEELQKHKKG